MADMFEKTARELANAEEALSEARIGVKQAQRRLEDAQRRYNDAIKFHTVEQVRRDMAAEKQ